MDELKFKSLNELYNRLLPALKSKKKELTSKGINYIHEEDIWNYLKQYVWKSNINLTLDKMVDDILNTKNSEFDDYMKKQIENYHRVIEKDNLL